MSDQAITTEQWLSALSEAMTPAGGEGLTARELCDRLGLSLKSMRELIARLSAEGRVACGRGARVAIDGRRAVVPVYRLKE